MCVRSLCFKPVTSTNVLDISCHTAVAAAVTASNQQSHSSRPSKHSGVVPASTPQSQQAITQQSQQAITQQSQQAITQQSSQQSLSSRHSNHSAVVTSVTQQSSQQALNRLAVGDADSSAKLLGYAEPAGGTLQQASTDPSSRLSTVTVLSTPCCAE